MNKEELINKFDQPTKMAWEFLLLMGYTCEEAADWMYKNDMVCYWERDILKGEY